MDELDRPLRPVPAPLPALLTGENADIYFLRTEAVLDGETGLLSPERDHHALAANLSLLLKDSELRRRLGRRGRGFVCERFCLRKQTAKLEQLYDRLTAESENVCRNRRKRR